MKGCIEKHSEAEKGDGERGEETTWSKSRLIESRAAGEDGETEEAAGVEVLVSGVIVTPFSSWSRLPLKSPSTTLTSDAALHRRQSKCTHAGAHTQTGKQGGGRRVIRRHVHYIQVTEGQRTTCLRYTVIQDCSARAEMSGYPTFIQTF